MSKAISEQTLETAIIADLVKGYYVQRPPSATGRARSGTDLGARPAGSGRGGRVRRPADRTGNREEETRIGSRPL
jgi:hypothetical protein